MAPRTGFTTKWEKSDDEIICSRRFGGAGTGDRNAFRDPGRQRETAGLFAWLVWVDGDRYDSFGGPGGALGCPVNDEHDVSEGRGRIQDFERGIITWSPSTGPQSVQTVWKQNGQLNFHWNSTSPLNYDDWLFNVRYNGQDRGLDREFRVGEVFGVDRSNGTSTLTRPADPGGRVR